MAAVTSSGTDNIPLTPTSKILGSPPRKKAPKSRSIDSPLSEEDNAPTRPKATRKKPMSKALSASAPSHPPEAVASSFKYEFGGPWGALGIVVGLPVVVMGLYYFCPNFMSSASPSSSSSKHPLSFRSSTSPLACLRWTDMAHFLTSTLPALLRALPSTFSTFASQARRSPHNTASAFMAIIQHIPGALKARGSALVALVQNELWDPLAFACIVAWFCFQVVLERLLPGEVALGVPLLGAEGLRLPYKLNGHLAFWISLLLLVHGCPRFAVPVEDEGILPTIVGDEGDEQFVYTASAAGDAVLQHAGQAANGAIPVLGELTGFGPFPLEKLYDHFPQFAFAAVVFSFGLSLLLYLASFRKGARLADGGRSGNVMYDFYMGRELNPRLGSFDWKYFCELRPGLIGWVALNMGMLMKQQQLQAVTGEPPSWPLVLVNVFQGWYVLDALLNERAILTTMDITTDGFGFMLAFGDLAWVPFTYSLQARYLVGRPVSLSTYALAGLSAMHLVGYWIFRQANSTKDAFRRDPTSVPHVRYMDTIRGTKLMVSGWWGWARKINYTGDWLMALAWCGLCGPTHVLPYFYAIYFGILLVHRAARDDHLCSLKYGADWQKYKKEVKWLFLPGIY